MSNALANSNIASELSTLPPAIRDSKIVVLCDKAILALEDARTLEDVLGIRDAAAAFATYTSKWRSATEAQNHCQLVVLLSEARIGSELKAAQERGEIATQQSGRPVSVRATDTYEELPKATLPEINIPRQRAAEFKALDDAGEPAIRAEVKAATEEGRRPSRGKIIKEAKQMRPAKAPKPRPSITRHIPSLAARPPQLTQFILWLRTGATLLRSIDPAEAVALLAEHAMTPDIREVETVSNFMSAMHGEMS